MDVTRARLIDDDEWCACCCQIGDFGCAREVVTDAALRSGMEMEGYEGILPPQELCPMPGREWTWDMYAVGVVTAQLVLAVHGEDRWDSTTGGTVSGVLVSRAVAHCQHAHEVGLEQVLRGATEHDASLRLSANECQVLMGFPVSNV